MKNVLTLFNGMGCAEITLRELGIQYDKCFASEIDKWALQFVKDNFPDTIQLGDVAKIDTSKLPEIWLLCGGSPCQSFSFAGKMKGMATKCEKDITSLEQYLTLKSEGFEFEGQSYLFWEFVRILKEVKPKYFFLENVTMVKKWENVITNALGVQPIEVNASLVSAQSRNRLFWTNINLTQVQELDMFGNVKPQRPNIKIPKDTGIVLRDILETNVDEKYYLSDERVAYFTKNSKKMKSLGIGYSFSMANPNGKSKTITTKEGSRMENNFISIVQNSHGFNKGGEFTEKAPTLTSNSWQENNFVKLSRLPIQLNNSKESGGKQPYQQNRFYSVESISPALCAMQESILIKSCSIRGINRKKGDARGIEIREDDKMGTLTQTYKTNMVFTKIDRKGNHNDMDLIKEDYSEYIRIRKLTPNECRALQTIPTWLVFNCSDAQTYKMLGNGWCINQIKIFFQYLKD